MPWSTDAWREHTTDSNFLHFQLSLWSTLECIALILGHISESSITSLREHHPLRAPSPELTHSVFPDSRLSCIQTLHKTEPNIEGCADSTSPPHTAHCPPC